MALATNTLLGASILEMPLAATPSETLNPKPLNVWELGVSYHVKSVA